jgi:hypothetical protein
MVTIHLDPSRLSLEELENVTRVLRGRCAECIERGVPAAARHSDEVNRFLDAVADAIEVARVPRERRAQERALAVDPDSGEWVAGA